MSKVREALKFVQYALAQDRDGLPIRHPEHGEICLEEVKYIVVDPALDNADNAANADNDKGDKEPSQ